MAADREHALREAMWAVTRAIELDSADAHGYALRAVNIMYRGQWDRYAEALADARRAHDMNPNDTLVLRIFGILQALAGRQRYRAFAPSHAPKSTQPSQLYDL